MNCTNDIRVQDIADMPIDNLESVPDYFLTERDVIDATTGETKRAITRTPGNKILPNATLDNVAAFEANNSAITIPDNQVRGVYMVEVGSTITMNYADTTHAPFMLAVGKTAANLILGQCSGFVNIPEGHSYSIGVQYYQGANGEPVTDSTSSMKLFIPVSRTKLAINM